MNKSNYIANVGHWLSILSITVVFGCGGTAAVVESPPPVINPEPEPVAFVSAPLPGVDSLVINEVIEDFDSTFVDADAQVQASAQYLEGQRLIDYAESLLTGVAGPSVLSSISQEPTTLDTTSFTDALAGAQESLSAAARAQASQDTAQVLGLLANAQSRFEQAVMLNPRHEESRYQLAQVYAIRANFLREQQAWEQMLSILRELVLLRADEHGLWAEIALALDQLERTSLSAVMWLRATQTVLDDAELSFDDAIVDSALVFNYGVRAYRSFVNSRNGEGVFRALMQSRQYATNDEQFNFATQELNWAQWDFFNLDHRLVFDSLRTVASDSPLEVIAELRNLIPQLTRNTAIWEATYNHAILSHSNGIEDSALDTLKGLWYTIKDFTPVPVMAPSTDASDTLSLASMPYPQFKEDVRLAYSGALFERALSHHQEGQSARAFTYLMQVVETQSSYAGRAYVEALKLARYNPEQALGMESEIENAFDQFPKEDKLNYLREMGNLYRRIGNNEKAASFLSRFRMIRNQTGD
ncbi:MAG: hypothetical protein OXE59_05180 [Bacteroidetes bacterium]|nr:hypothetical protein [Bacteroidota bacterium]